MGAPVATSEGKGGGAWRRLSANHVSRIDLWPHAIFDEGLGVAAIGFLAYLRPKPGVAARSRVTIPTAAFDCSVPCQFLASGHYKAMAVALRAFASLRPDLVTCNVRLLTQDQGLNFVLKNFESPNASSNVRHDLEEDRNDVLDASRPYRSFFRYRYYSSGDRPLPQPLVARRDRMVAPLRERLLRTQFNRTTEPRPARLVVDVDEIGRLVRSRQSRNAKVPSPLEAIVGHLNGRGIGHARIAAALAQDPRAIRNALARWRLGDRSQAPPPGNSQPKVP